MQMKILLSWIKVDVLDVLLLVAIQVWLTNATQLFHVLPDDPTNVSCPSQPCATLSQYLLDNNGTLRTCRVKC